MSCSSGRFAEGFAWVYDQADGAAADGTPAYGLGRLTGTQHPSGSSSYAYDALGRVVRETQRLGATSTGAGGSVREVRYRYDDAGETDTSGLGPFTFNLRMPGQYADRETGLFYNHFRDYDPGVGRHVQSDPIGVLGGSTRMRMWAGTR